jgi:acid phosphatase (class A)
LYGCLLAVAGILTPDVGDAQSELDAVPEIRRGVPAGYLQPEDRPDSVTILPAPPALGSAAHALDVAINEHNLTLRDTPRWDQAMTDAIIRFPQAAGIFSCALNAPITEADAPHLYLLLRRTLIDAGRSTVAAKEFYKRPRPLHVNGEPSCKNTETFSYPSGHTSAGWAWALILAEIDPEHAEVILARGRAFGESRMVCNLHWHSDVQEGRTMGAAAVARLHADPTFLADMELAKAEFKSIREKGLPPSRDCAAESEALTQSIYPR